MKTMNRNTWKFPRLTTFSTAIAAGLLGLSVAATSTLAAEAPATTRPSNGTPVVHSAPRTVEVIEVTVGESRSLDAIWPVKRVSVADPKIAEVDAATPNKITIQGKAVGITELALESEKGEVWRARIAVNADTGRLQNRLRKIFANSTLEVSQVDDIIVIKGMLAR